MKLLLYALMVVLIIGTVLVLTNQKDSSAPIPTVKKSIVHDGIAKQSVAANAQTTAAVPTSVARAVDDNDDSVIVGSPIAAKLNAADSSPQQDVDTLHELVLQYLHNMRHPNALPIGDSIDLARALTGHNPMHFVVIPPQHPAISSDGRLLDRWGTSYFVHPVGGGVIDIHSAGPDKKLFTVDDLIANP